MQNSQVLLVGVRHDFEYVISANPSALEQEQRCFFLKRVRELIRDFNPTVIASENRYTNNEELLTVFGKRLILIDIPHEERVAKSLHVHRPNAGLALCQCVDGVREEYWKQKINDSVRESPVSRVIAFMGALHLQRFPSRPKSFADLMQTEGYSVSSIDLTAEPWAKEEWQWIPSEDHRAQVSPRPCRLAMGFDSCPDWER